MKNSAFAENIISNSNFFVEIPKTIIVNGIGPCDYSITHGLPTDEHLYFTMLVENSLNPDYWQITTNKPIGVTISYNSGGNILAVFVSLKRIGDNYEIPSSDISIYPSKVIFDTGSEGGDSQRVFHFYPIIKVSKNTPPGNYVGSISFTVIGQ